MKTIPLRFFFFTFIFILAISLTSPALAHGDEPRLEISADRMNPGGVIEVRGVDFEFEELVALALIGSETEVALGDIAADIEGIFLQIITLPVDLPEGSYHFRAVTDDHEILSSTLLVQGPAIMNEEGGGQRDEEDSLLAPMPTFAPDVVPGASPASTQSAAPVPVVEGSGINPSTIVVLVIILVAVGAIFVQRQRRR